jgi:hypothetical protein
VAVALSPVILVIAVSLERSRGRELDREAVEHRWQGRLERCVACHAAEKAALRDGSHRVEAVGCSGCHLGNPLALDADRAHAGMERFPGDFETLTRTCGRLGCHPDAARRVQGSLMGTARGILAVNRHVFGETGSPSGQRGFGDLSPLRGPGSLAEAHARKLCGSCHLGTRHRGSAPGARARGGGCSACHLQPGAGSGAHPRLRLGVSSGRCTGCHARSGRISLSYYGWHEGRVGMAHTGDGEADTSEDEPVTGSEDRGAARAAALVEALAPLREGGPDARRLEDGRTVYRARADVHARAGLGCVDCHTNVGLMGDGVWWAHKEQQVDIACTDCHARVGSGEGGEVGEGSGKAPRPLTKTEQAQRRIDKLLHGGAAWTKRVPLIRTRRGTPLQALRAGDSPPGRRTERSGAREPRSSSPAAGTWRRGEGKMARGARWPRWQRRRSDGRWLRVKATPADAAHTLPGHARLSCQACHTAWAHQCSGCHTRREGRGRQWDNVSQAFTPGRWVERPGDIRIDRPTLGVDPDGWIRPFVPGMPLCIDDGRSRRDVDPRARPPARGGGARAAARGRAGGARCSRWFAPASPHTTQREARSCASCHRDPLALGLGRGRLVGRPGAWRFVPRSRKVTSRAGARLLRVLPPWPDGVPWDGWTRLRGTPRARATREGARPLSPRELRRVLDVGPCLRCHGTYRDAVYRDFRASLWRLRIDRAPGCTAPESLRAWP